MIQSFSALFKNKKPVIGMIHLLPLPGTPFFAGSLDSIIDRAISDARELKKGGVDGALIQNRGDKAFAKTVSAPEIVASITLITKAVRDEVDFPIGVHLLRNDVLASLAVAKCCNAEFIRVGAAIGTTVLPQGVIEADPSSTIKAIKRLNAENIKLYCDVDSFHYNPITTFPAEEVTRELLDLNLTNGVIIAFADSNETIKTIERIRALNSNVPIILGGYTSEGNIENLLSFADGAIVGGAFEEHGRNGPVNAKKVEAFMNFANKARR